MTNRILPPGLYGGELQAIIDQLYEETRLPVVLTDYEMNVLSASRHDQVIDRNRNTAILRRRTPIQSRQYARQLSIDTRRGPVRVPPRPSIGMDLSRWCYRLTGSVPPLGFLWMLASPDAAADPPLGAADVHCDRIEQVVLRAAAEYADAEHAEGDRVFAMISGEMQQESRPVAVATESLPPQFEVSVLRPVDRRPGVSAMYRKHVLVHLARCGVRDACLVGTLGDDVIVIRDHACYERVDAAFTALTDGAAECRIGTSEVDSNPQTLPELTRQARFAADLASLPEHDGWVHWHQLGPWLMLYGLPQTTATLDALCPGMSALVVGKHETLARTALVYLEESSSAATTAERLSIHRTTLYYRLRGIDAILGADWHCGWRRVAVHAALNLSKLLDSSEQSG